ncbi:ATP-binding cassette domain-containing protein [Bacillus lacus]|uniref:ATP-binding cassette domain-containing protein n=1 Tax=Metabacillus lacus TaxID=1983721 RepID=A0A7X2LXI8_9BACI|nr:ABC transporter ATP-binding protein [Metabacillus lacus]MRX70763.1 ATP-binding cassette domain-containing protein [Metabacillus lacus]
METNQQGQWRQFLQLLRIGKPAKALIILALLLSLFETAASLAIPLFTGDIVDQLANQGIEPRIAVFLLAVFVIQIISGGFSYYLMTKIGETFVARIREKLWGVVLALPIPYFDKHQSGETMSRITQDTNTVKTLVTNHLVTFVSGIITILGSIIILIIIDWRMTMIMLLAIPVSMLIIMPLGKKIHKISKQTQDEMARFSGELGRVLSDIRLVKSYNGQPIEFAKGREGIRKLFYFGLKEAKIQAIVSPLMTTVMMLILVVIIGYGGARVASGLLSAGSLVAIIIYMFQIIVPFSQLAMFFTAFQKAMGATERIQTLLNTQQEKSNDVLPVKSHRTFSFQDIFFSYGEKQILKGITFEAHEGETVAFVGPSGGGKTTIFSLIERFYSPTSGTITLDNTNIQDFSLSDWRGQIGYVSQESPIMSGSIKDNISYGIQREVSDDEIQNAAKLANAAEFIQQLPDGYDTEVGERGIKLSGGQRQRIAVARALIRNPKILLLDEATSNLDSESEVLVQEALKFLMEGRTTFIIAHRLSTVIHSDQILVVEAGEITGRGTHSELLNNHSLYTKLVKQQLKGGTRIS